MRNMARRGAKSDIHFIADGDMVMSEGFAIKAKNIANQMIDGKSKDVLVVRRFETGSLKIPKNPVDLAESVKNQTVFEFHHKCFFKGHKLENLTYWLNKSSEKLSEVNSWPIPYAGVFWEVQVILHRNDLYNADYFPARIRDMQTLIYSLCRANYTFHLLSHVFNVHEGVKTADTTYSKAVVAHQKAFVKNKAFNRFNQELNAMYPHTFAKCGNFIL
uniref:Uncharacterized protein n=2 Tax=Caenorhabditis japonica TaxID=281687 RepID=A0A8R1IA19_CAEJA